MVGGIVANGILFSLSPGPLMVDLKLGSGISATQGCFIEMFTTANLVLSVLMLSAGESCYLGLGQLTIVLGRAAISRVEGYVLIPVLEKHLLTPHAPLAFAFTLFAMMLYSIEYTGTGMKWVPTLNALLSLADACLSTARAFGTACLSGFPSHHWIYCE